VPRARAERAAMGVTRGPEVTEPRAVCPACRRPVVVCWCPHVPRLETRTRVVVLQHPRERDMPIGTARMAHLCLPGSELHVGVSWDDSPELARVLSDPERPAILLYPGADAVDLGTSPPPGPVTLVVVDGTWAHARKVVNQNPRLGRLPRYAFTPTAPSEYRIRAEPEEACVSTIEALAHALGALEGDPERFRAMLVPFRAMVDAQIACAAAPSPRVRHPRPATRRAPPSPPVPPALLGAVRDVVCVAVEANAWPYRGREGHAPRPDELVHWVAVRLGTGEVLDVVVAPAGPLAPATATHVRLDESAIRAGVPVEALHAAWRGFAREGDVVCAWGRYGTSLFVSQGGWLPPARVDLRVVARTVARRRVGTLEELAVSLAVTAPPARAPGRAGARASQLEAVVLALRSAAAVGP